ncbi:ComEC/Rec2 family competence protein [Ruegeria marina]|uniref:ComEC/Rec2 family competence protein n=1 Tax=Ruegeria marina TaxID=639004 RepID=UPI001FDF5321|nr:ComEC/Rec2 family competence protein [Ruegeria marina]
MYFAPLHEPGLAVIVTCATLALVLAFVAVLHPGAWTPLIWAAALVAAGVVLVSSRAHHVAAPVLGWRYFGPVEGRVVGLDRSATDRLRVTLDQVRLDRVPPAAVPHGVRISVPEDSLRIIPGARIMTTAHLSPPQGPVEPGGFDFRRHAWFQRLGAVGYTRAPVVIAALPDHDEPRLHVFAIRVAISKHIQDRLPGDVGGFAAAVTTGDRSGVGEEAIAALRASNLAHLLAISGLHMGLLAGFVYSSIRFGLSLIPSLALRLPVRKLAAIGALVVAAGYLALSGGNVATQRAFVMVAVMLGAVLVDRRALSLRSLSVAALVVLLLRPEALLGPGFQMSFAATVALVAVFGWVRDADIMLGPRWLQPVMGVVLSSAVAGLATAPFGAAHFNTVAHYGLMANLVSVPVMGTLVIPSAVLALVLTPVGLDWIGLELMGLGLRWILAVAHWVQDLDGAQGHVVSSGPAVLPLLALGGLWLVLWRGRLRLAGGGAMILALGLWAQAERPAILIADTAGLVGVMTDEGRALSKPRGAGFIADVWLENDGDGADQATAAARWPDSGGTRRLSTGTVEVIHVTGKRSAGELTTCLDNQIVVSAVPLTLDGSCLVFDADHLLSTGSVSLTRDGKLTGIAGEGRRLWSPPRSFQ